MKNFAFFLFLSASFLSARADSVFSTNSFWEYFKGRSEASSPDPAAWRQVGFNDSSWTLSQAPFFYENDPGSDNPTAYTGNTDLTDMFGGYTCIFMRQTFVLTNVAQIKQLQLTAVSDDGFIAWIN